MNTEQSLGNDVGLPQSPRSSRQPVWWPLIAGAAVALATLGRSEAVRLQERVQMSRVASAAANSLRSGIKSRVSDRIGGFFAVASRWTTANSPRTRAEFEAQLGPDLAAGL